MAVLTPGPRRGLRAAAFALCGLGYLSAVACLSTSRSLRAPLFPHAIHVGEHGIACITCHPDTATERNAGMPPPELCAPCHDAIDPGKPAARTIAGLFDASGEWIGPKALPLSDEILFSHADHACSLECDACHDDPDAPRDESRPLQAKAECMGCHQERARPDASCATCHRDVDENWLPPSHQHNWPHRHGGVVRMGSDASVDACELCHDPVASCAACHHNQAPADHGHHFRTRGHGIAAAIDRARCATCHTQDSCTQCHQTTRPRSHRAGFGETANRHCVGCHLPVQDNGCAACHPSTPSHDLATPLPASHLPSMNCRACHGAGQPLPHPDGGHVCTACHR